MRRFALTSLIALLPSLGFAQDAVFASYDAMQSRMFELMKSRQIAQLMIEFGASDEMTQQQLDGLEARVRQIFPRDFAKVEMIRQIEYQNGWKQEMYAFYTGVDYIYTYVLIHERPDMTAAVNFRFNSAFDEVNNAF